MANERHLQSKEKAQREIRTTVHSAPCPQSVMGSSAQSHFFITGGLTFPLCLALSLTGADTHSHTVMLGFDGGVVFDRVNISLVQWFFFLKNGLGPRKANVLRLIFSFTKKGVYPVSARDEAVLSYRTNPQLMITSTLSWVLVIHFQATYF